MSYQLFSEVVKKEYPQTSLAKSTEEQQNENSNQTEETQNFCILKTDTDKRLIFGWASVAVNTDGEQVIDHQKDMIDPEDLEEAVYEYVLNFRDGGEEHIESLRKKAKMVESCVFTKEKMHAMGLPEGILPEGWWIGFYVTDDEAWEKVKDGTYKMFSIEGQGIREEVEETEEVNLGKSATFDEDNPPMKRKIKEPLNDDTDKFNPYHDARGRFSTANGAASFTIRTKDPKKQHWADMAIARVKEKKPADDDEPTTTPKKPQKATKPKSKANTPPKQNEPQNEPQAKPQTASSNTATQTKHPSAGFGNKIPFVAKLTNSSDTEAYNMIEAVGKYSGSYYEEIRAAAVKNEKTTQAGKYAQQVEEFIDKSPKWAGGQQYRGISVDKNIANQILASAKNGEKLDMRGMSSWSSDKGVAVNFAAGNKGDVKIIFHTNSTKSKYGTSIRYLSLYPDEDEVLHSAKARYKATEIKHSKKDGKDYYDIFVDEV